MIWHTGCVTNPTRRYCRVNLVTSEDVDMRLWILPFAALIGFTVGCNKSPEGGTAGTAASFKLSLPATTKDVKQGTSETYEGSIDRGSEFKKDVKLKVDAPDKVEVKLTKDTIKASETDTKFSITVTPAKDAPAAEHTIKITGTPDGGGSATVGEFKIKVTG
jgi:hypothetical protein